MFLYKKFVILNHPQLACLDIIITKTEIIQGIKKIIVP